MSTRAIVLQIRLNLIKERLPTYLTDKRLNHSEVTATPKWLRGWYLSIARVQQENEKPMVPRAFPEITRFPINIWRK